MNSIFLQNRSISLKILGAVSLMLASTVHAIIDSNSNGMSDLWEENFNQLELFPPSFGPQADPDNDGWTNAQEAAAGTDPFDPNSPAGFIRPAIAHSSAVWHDPDGDEIHEIATPEAHVVTWPTLAGKQYTLLLSVDLTAGSWIPIGQPRIGEGTPLGTGIPLTEADTSMFWRVKIEDIDSDDDGITDHEESQLGTDPYLADRDRDGMPDFWELANSLNADDDGNTNFLFGADGDPDGDGASNLEEFLEETDPNDPNDIPVQIHSIERISRQQCNNYPDSEQAARWIVSWSLWDQAIPVNSQFLSTIPYEPAAVGPDLASKIPYAAAQPATALKYPLPARHILLENGSYTRYAETIGNETFTTTLSSLTQSRLWMKIPPKRISLVSQKIPYLFYTLRTVYAYQGGGYGAPQTPQSPGAQPPTRTVYSHETIKFEFDPNSATSKPLDVNSQLSGGQVGTTTISEYRLIRPEITWKAIGDYANVDDHIDPWTNKQNGKRVFPDFKNPDDTKIRHKLEVIVKTSSDLVGQPVFVKAFDVDDSTSEEFDREADDGNPNTAEHPIIDTTGNGGSDNLPDYLGTDQNGNFLTGSAWGSNTAQGVVGADGETKFIFKVGMQPGSNYRIVASVIDESMYDGVQTSNPAAAKYLGAEPSQNGEAPASKLLTVWRRLWVEQDTMWSIGTHQSEYNSNDIAWDSPTYDLIGTNPIGNPQTATGLRVPTLVNDWDNMIDLENGSVVFNDESHSIFATLTGSDYDVVAINGDFTSLTAGTAVRVYDDDGFGFLNSRRAPFQIDLVDMQMRNYFKTAFIEPVDGRVYNVNEKVLFKANVGSRQFPVPAEYASDDINETDNLWVAPVTLAYQGERSEDNDPNFEDGGMTYGVTDNVGEIEQSFVFVEVCRDGFDYDFRLTTTIANSARERLPMYIIATAAHEMGHQPGYEPNVLNGDHHDELELMREGGPSPNGDITLEQFSAKTVERFRKSQKWCK